MKVLLAQTGLIVGLLGVGATLTGQTKQAPDDSRKANKQHLEKHKDHKPGISAPQDARNEHRPKSPKEDEANEHERLLLLKRLLDMPPERLSMLKATISRLENLSPQEKKRLAERIENFGRMPPQERRKLHESFREDERKRWDTFHRRHKNLPSEQRNQELQRVHSLPPHERRMYFERLRHHHGGKRPTLPAPRRREAPPRPPLPKR